MKNVIIMGAGGRDFHDFNTVYRDDPGVDVVAFTATQIPGIDERRHPPSLAGELYPAGIPVYPEKKLPELIRELEVDEVVFAYSDVSHETVMHKASIALAAGADFRLLGPKATMLESTKPVGVPSGADRRLALDLPRGLGAGGLRRRGGSKGVPQTRAAATAK